MNNSIFIHSLFRAGSTYLFNVFRRAGGYWCYQEPLHEVALYARDEPKVLLLDQGDEKRRLLRHPHIEKQYFQELHDVWPTWKDRLSQPAIYASYFAPLNVDIGIEYWQALIDAAQGRPVFQECRTAGRMKEMREQLGGFHIYLWRNPWDQWWSYKVTPYFDVANLLIIHAPYVPLAVRALCTFLGFEPYVQEDIEKAFAHFSATPLTSEESYLIFYLLWCLAIQAGMQSAHLLLNIDRLSDSSVYREEIQAQLAKVGIDGIDFSDCQIPQGSYPEQDQEFFISLENKIHQLLQDGGWSYEELTLVQTLRQRFQPLNWSEPPQMKSGLYEMAVQASRARTLARRFESNLAGVTREWMVKVGEIEREARQVGLKMQMAQEKVQQVEEMVLRAEERARRAEERAQRAEERARQAEMKVKQSEVSLQNVYDSRSWRITSPLRRGSKSITWFVRGCGAWLTFTPMSRHWRIVQKVILFLNMFFYSHPRLKMIVLRLLVPFPHLKVRLQRMGCSHVKSAGLPLTIKECEYLTPRVCQIYDDLRAAIARFQKEQG